MADTGVVEGLVRVRGVLMVWLVAVVLKTVGREGGSAMERSAEGRPWKEKMAVLFWGKVSVWVVVREGRGDMLTEKEPGAEPRVN